MIRTIALSLNNFGSVPQALRQKGQSVARPEVGIDLAKLFHHLFINKHGSEPPDPNPVYFEYLPFFVPTAEFRFCGDGIGVTKQAKLQTSNQMGEALCRLFLHDYLDIPYFAHIEHALKGTVDADKFGALKVERVSAGDLPDYLCADARRQVSLAEAKGRSSSISFGSTQFATWRKQFSRVRICDAQGVEYAAKGYVIASRLATEHHGSRVKSRIFAEDPRSLGDMNLEGSDRQDSLATRVIALHYSRVAEKIKQPILAAALASGSIVPEDIRIIASVWEYQVGPLAARRFVGGYFPGASARIIESATGVGHSVVGAEPWILGAHGPAFFGVEESVFRGVVKLARAGASASRGIEPFVTPPFFYSAVSILRDGSLLSPVEFLKLVQPAAEF